MTAPILKVNKDTKRDVVISARFAHIPNCTFELWMYESMPNFSLPDVASAQWDDRTSFKFVRSKTLSEESLELEHEIVGYDGVTLKTTLRSFNCGIEIVVKPIVLDSNMKNTATLPVPNLCFQTANAEAFNSSIDSFKCNSEDYQEFVGRCFIFGNKGPVFLNTTIRRKNNLFSSDDEDNPPRAQLYAALHRDIPLMSAMFGAGHSTEKFLTPVIGIVSKDKKHLVAVATKNADLIWQAYIDCVHNNPNWEPSDGPIEERMLRTQIIVMENNFESLLQYVHKVF